jgi:hypothetical protein
MGTITSCRAPVLAVALALVVALIVYSTTFGAVA